jgi:hypothetical protein
MSGEVYEDFDDVLPPRPNGELVHWMDAPPMSFGPAAISLAVVGAFAAGLAAGILALSLQHMAGRERRMSLPLDRKLRGLN